MTCDDLSTSCLRRQLLEFFENTKLQEIAGINRDELERRAAQDNRAVVKPPQPFDSWFEVDVALELFRKGFEVVPQFDVAGKRIDLVVEGGRARLAVECDGDIWHGVGQYEADMQRQRMLERCGWVFFRVRECAFYSDRERALEVLWRLLEERGILPASKMREREPDATSQPTEESDDGRNDEKESATSVLSASTNNGAHPVRKVAVGTTVVYVNEDERNGECQALITDERSNPEWGTMNANTPIAKALLGGEVGQLIVAHLPVGSVRLRIVDIR